MLRWEEKQDIDERLTTLDEAVHKWRILRDAASDAVRKEFDDKLLISWIYHDAALEGEVLTYSEIKASTDTSIISDVSLIPAYEDIKAFDTACRYGLQHAKERKKTIDLDFLHQVYDALVPEQAAQGAPYRKDNPLHRLYYHDIAAPETIADKMKELATLIGSDALEEQHAVEAVVTVHRKVMEIFPWAKHTGQAARVFANAALERANYPLAVIHAIDRQRYYEALRNDDDKLLLLYIEAVETTADAGIRVFEEAALGPRRGRRRAS